MTLKTIAANAWQKLRWILWRRAVVREAKADFSESWSATSDVCGNAARHWVAAHEPALRWWFANGATPPEAYQAVSEENGHG